MCQGNSPDQIPTNTKADQINDPQSALCLPRVWWGCLLFKVIRLLWVCSGSAMGYFGSALVLRFTHCSVKQTGLFSYYL